MDYQLANGFDGVVMKTPDGAVVLVPNDPDNSEWSTYQAWLAEGGSPNPAGGLSFVPVPDQTS